MEATTAEDQTSESDGSCTNLRTLASLGPEVSDDRRGFETTKDRFRVTYQVDFKNDGPLEFRDFTVDITDNFGLVEYDSAESDGGKSFIVIADAGRYSVETDVTPNNGATYTVTVEECSSSQGGTPPETTTPETTAPESTAPENTTPVEDQSKPKKVPSSNVSNPKDVIPGSGAKKIPNTGGPPYLAISALALLGAALIVGRGVWRR